VKFFQTASLLLVLCLGQPILSSAEPLTFSYFERPPYYFTTGSGDAGGFLVDRTRKILHTAEIEGQFVALTPYRIFYVLKHAPAPHCSIGWFKNSERELFAKFTKPFYQNRALVLLTSKVQQSKFSGKISVRQLFSNRKISLARLAEFSYGDLVDGLLGELSPQSVLFTGEQTALLQAIMEQRATYMLVAPEEIDLLTQAAGVSKEDVVALPLTDAPIGNLRYLMCNQAVSDQIMEKMNRAIVQLYAQGEMEKQ